MTTNSTNTNGDKDCSAQLYQYTATASIPTQGETWYQSSVSSLKSIAGSYLGKPLGTVATYAASSQIANALIDIDPDRNKKNIAIIESLDEGKFLLFLIPKFSSHLAEILAKQLYLISNLYYGKNSRDSFISSLDSIFLKALANLIEKTPAPRDRKKSIEDVLEFVASKLDAHMSEAQVQRFLDAGDAPELDPLVKALLSQAKANVSALTPTDIRTIALQDVISHLLKEIFPNGEADLGIKADALRGLGASISSAIWNLLPSVLPPVISPLYSLVMEKRADSEKQKQSIKNSPGGKAILLLVQFGSITVISQVNQTVNPPGGKFEGSTQERILQATQQQLISFCQVGEKENKSLESEQKAKMIETECSNGSMHIIKVIQNLTKTSSDNMHPLQKRCEELARNRIEPVFIQALTHLMGFSPKPNLLDRLFDVIKPLIAEIYAKSGKALKNEYEVHSNLEVTSNIRIKWIKDNFGKYAAELLEKLKLDGEISRRLSTSGDKAKDKASVDKALKQLSELAPGILFAAFGALVSNQPSVLSWMHPEGLYRETADEVGSYAFGPVYIATATLVAETVMSDLTFPALITPEVAKSIASSLISKLFTLAPKLAPDNIRKENHENNSLLNTILGGEKELQEWVTSELIRFSSHGDYKELRTFVRTHIEGIILELIKAKGENFSPFNFAAVALNDVITAVNGKPNIYEKESLTQSTLRQIIALDNAHQSASSVQIEVVEDENVLVGNKENVLGLIPDKKFYNAKAEHDTKKDMANPDKTPAAPKKDVENKAYQEQRLKLVDQLTVCLQPTAQTILKLLGVDQITQLKFAGLNGPDGLIEYQFARQLVNPCIQIERINQEKTTLTHLLEDEIYDPNVANSVVEHPRKQFIKQGGLEAFWKKQGVREIATLCLNIFCSMSDKVIEIGRSHLNPPQDPEQPDPDAAFAKSLAEKSIKFLKEQFGSDSAKHFENELRSISDIAIPANKRVWTLVRDVLENVIVHVALNIINGANVNLTDPKNLRSIDKLTHKHQFLPQKALTKVLEIFSEHLQQYKYDPAQSECDEKGEKNKMSCSDAATELVTLLLGKNIPNHTTMNCIPLMTPEMEIKGRTMLLEYLKYFLPNVFQDMDQRAALRKSYADLETISQTAYLHESFQKQKAKPFKDFHDNVNTTMHDLVPSLLKNRATMEGLIRNSLLPYLPKCSDDIKNAFVKWIVDNCEAFGAKDCPELKALQEFAANTSSAFAVKMVTGLQKTLHRASTKQGKHHTSFMVAQFTQAVAAADKHISAVNKIVQDTRKKACDIPPAELNQKLQDAKALHISLKPIAISAEIRKQIESDVINGPRKKEFEAMSWLTKNRAISRVIETEIQNYIEKEKYKRDITHFYTPLFNNFLKASGIRAEDMPILKGSQDFAYKFFQQMGPSLLYMIDKMTMSPGSIEGMKRALILKMEIMFRAMEKNVNAKRDQNVPAVDIADPLNDVILSDEIRKELEDHCGKFVQPAVILMLEEGIAQALFDNVDALKNSLKENGSKNLSYSIEMMAASNPLQSMFTQIIGSVAACMEKGKGPYVLEDVTELSAKVGQKGFNVVINGKLKSISDSISNTFESVIAFGLGKTIARGITWFFGRIADLIKFIFDVVFNKILQFDTIYQYGLKSFAKGSIETIDRALSLECNESLRRGLMIAFSANLAAEKDRQDVEDKLTPDQLKAIHDDEIKLSEAAKKGFGLSLMLLLLNASSGGRAGAVAGSVVAPAVVAVTPAPPSA